MGPRVGPWGSGERMSWEEVDPFVVEGSRWTLGVFLFVGPSTMGPERRRPPSRCVDRWLP